MGGSFTMDLSHLKKDLLEEMAKLRKELLADNHNPEEIESIEKDSESMSE